MKKSNRISQNGGISPSSDQVKQPSEKLGKRPERNISNEPIKKLVERLKKRSYTHEPKRAEIRLATCPALVDALRQFLGLNSFAGLAEIEKEFGCSIEAQLAGAIGTWLAFVEDRRMQKWDRSEEYLRKVVTEATGVLDPSQVDFILQEQRPKTVSKRAAQFFLLSLRQQMERPFREARPILEGLKDLIEGHPGFTDQHSALQIMLDGVELSESYTMSDWAGLPRVD